MKRIKPELDARPEDAPFKESILRAFNDARHDGHRFMLIDRELQSIRTVSGDDWELSQRKPRAAQGDA